ncbi:MAG TPA: hypothetical protein VIK33_18350 [Anaerolineae bacterium]
MSSTIHFFENADDSPRPPEEVRILHVRAEVSPDGRRVAVSVELTPFFQKPDFDVTLLRGGEEVRSTSVVGAMQPQTQLTLHLPPGDSRGTYLARVDLLRDQQVVQTETAAFEVN